MLKSCVKKSQSLQFCSGMVKGPVVAVMDREAGSHIGVRDRFHTHATHDRAPLGGPTPSAGGPFDFFTHELHLPAYPPTKENGNQLGWPQTWVKLGSAPRKALTDQPCQDSALLESSSGLVLCWKIQAARR